MSITTGLSHELGEIIKSSLQVQIDTRSDPKLSSKFDIEYLKSKLFYARIDNMSVSRQLAVYDSICEFCNENFLDEKGKSNYFLLGRNIFFLKKEDFLFFCGYLLTL